MRFTRCDERISTALGMYPRHGSFSIHCERIESEHIGTREPPFFVSRTSLSNLSGFEARWLATRKLKIDLADKTCMNASIPVPTRPGYVFLFSLRPREAASSRRCLNDAPPFLPHLTPLPTGPFRLHRCGRILGRGSPDRGRADGVADQGLPIRSCPSSSRSSAPPATWPIRCLSREDRESTTACGRPGPSIVPTARRA